MSGSNKLNFAIHEIFWQDCRSDGYYNNLLTSVANRGIRNTGVIVVSSAACCSISHILPLLLVLLFVVAIVVVCSFIFYNCLIKNKNKKKKKSENGIEKATIAIVNDFSSSSSNNNNDNDDKHEESKDKECPWPVVPGAIPIIGNIIPGGSENIAVTFEKWAKLYGDEYGVYICYIGMNKLIILCNNEKITEVEKYRPYIVRRRRNVARALESVSAGGIFTAEGATWKKERKLVGPALNRKNVRDYVSIAKLIASRLVTKWEKHLIINTATQEGSNQEEFNGNNNVVIINNDLLAYSMDIISLVALAKDIDTLRSSSSNSNSNSNSQHGDGTTSDTDHQIGKDIKFIFKRAMMRIFAPFPFWNIPIVGQYIDGSGFAIQRAKKMMKQIIYEHKQNNEEEEQQEQNNQDDNDDEENKSEDENENDSVLQNSQSNSNSNSNTQQQSNSNSKQQTNSKQQSKQNHTKTNVVSYQDRTTKSFLSKILTLSKKENILLTEDRIIGNLLTMFSAGSETTYNVLIVCLYEIAYASDNLQDELYNEIITLFGTNDSDNTNDNDDNKNDNHSDNIGYNVLQSQLPRLRSLMYEVLRMKGPTPIYGAESTKEFYLDGYKQPVDTQFIFMSRYASTIEPNQEDGEDEDGEDTNEPEPEDDSKRNVPKGMMNSPVNEFCPRRWLVVHENKEEEQEECNDYTNDHEHTDTTKRTKTKMHLNVIKPTIKSGFRSYGSSLRVCPGRDLAEMEILVLISYVLNQFHISLKRNHEPLKYVTRIAQTTDSNVELVLKLRKDKKTKETRK